MRLYSTTFAIVMALAFAAALPAAVTDSDFGKLADGSPVRLYTITNKGGSAVQMMTYGGTVVSIKMPDRAGRIADVALGFDNLAGYLGNNPLFGALVGRYANRIKGATFTLDGVQYKLTPNERGSTMHGGKRGFDKVMWTAAKIDDQTVEFTYLSKDGEEGYPGNLTVHTRYSLSDANEFKVDYSAKTDKNTVVNLTNHSYFNLAGEGNGDVLNQELTIYADQYTPVDALSIPTGKLVDVAGTPFDFRTPHKIGERIAADDQQIRFGNGYDHNFVLSGKDGLHPAATVYDPGSGRVMEVSTTEPGVQLYTANGMDGSVAGKGGKKYPKHGAVCLETEHFPNSPNQPEFPSTELKVGQTYHSMTVYRFSTRAEAATKP
jgi:aldose 1-epimerase